MMKYAVHRGEQMRKEPINAKVIVGALLITAGRIVMLYK